LTHNFYHFVSEAAESLVFAYLGLTSYSYHLFSIPFTFLALMFLSTLVARLIGTFVLSYVVQIVTCKRHCLGFKNLSMICIGGIVRGGISFALALTFVGDNSEVLQALILAFVMVGTIVCGTVLPLWVKLMNVQESGSVVGPEGTEENSNPVIRFWTMVNSRWLRKWLVIKEKSDPDINFESTPEIDRTRLE
jgi:NhaP-type Na+/H+ or K+/H+ antiporter